MTSSTLAFETPSSLARSAAKRSIAWSRWALTSSRVSFSAARRSAALTPRSLASSFSFSWRTPRRSARRSGPPGRGPGRTACSALRSLASVTPSSFARPLRSRGPPVCGPRRARRGPWRRRRRAPWRDRRRTRCGCHRGGRRGGACGRPGVRRRARRARTRPWPRRSRAPARATLERVAELVHRALALVAERAEGGEELVLGDAELLGGVGQRAARAAAEIVAEGRRRSRSPPPDDLGWGRRAPIRHPSGCRAHRPRRRARARP